MDIERGEDNKNKENMQNKNHRIKICISMVGDGHPET